MQLLCEAYIELAYVNVTHLKAERGMDIELFVLTQLSNKDLALYVYFRGFIGAFPGVCDICMGSSRSS